MSLTDGRTQAGLRAHVDVVVYRPDPSMYGRMIVLTRDVRKVKGDDVTFVVCEVDPPVWRFSGILRSDRPAYDPTMATFFADELWSEAEWSAPGQTRDAAVAAGYRGV